MNAYIMHEDFKIVREQSAVPGVVLHESMRLRWFSATLPTCK